jgi:hypothetical protein
MIFNEIVAPFNHVHKKIPPMVGDLSKQTNILESIEDGLTQQLSNRRHVNATTKIYFGSQLG